MELDENDENLLSNSLQQESMLDDEPCSPNDSKIIIKCLQDQSMMSKIPEEDSLLQTTINNSEDYIESGSKEMDGNLIEIQDYDNASEIKFELSCEKRETKPQTYVESQMIRNMPF